MPPLGQHTRNSLPTPPTSGWQTWPPAHMNMTVVAGAESCSSSSLVDVLALQRGVLTPQLQPGDAQQFSLHEGGPGFFSTEDCYTRGLDWYRSHFPQSAVEPAMLVDGSRSSFRSPFAAARMRAILARPSHHRIVIVLRDPAHLAWALWGELHALPASEDSSSLGALLSPYLHPRNFTLKAELEVKALSRCLGRGGSGGKGGESSKDGNNGAPFAAITSESWQRCMAVSCGWSGCIVGAGLYAPQLRTWRVAYQPHQLAVFTLTELATEPKLAVHRLLDFVGLTTSVPLCVARPELLARATERATRDIARGDTYSDGDSGGPWVPASGYDLLNRFYANFARGVRHELALMKQPQRTAAMEPWLWADGAKAADLVVGSASGRSSRRAVRSSASGVAPNAVVQGSQTALAIAGSAARADGLDGGSNAGLDRGSQLPTVFLLGCEKCGSTSLAFALSRHSQIRMARHALPGEPAFFRKETHFFDDDLRYTRGLGFYAAHFPQCLRGGESAATATSNIDTARGGSDGTAAASVAGTGMRARRLRRATQALEAAAAR